MWTHATVRDSWEPRSQGVPDTSLDVSSRNLAGFSGDLRKVPQWVQNREGVNTLSLSHSDGPGKTVTEAVSSARPT